MIRNNWVYHMSSTARLTLFATLLLSTAAAAEDKATAYPHLETAAVFELQTEQGIDSDDPDNERNHTFGRMEVAPVLTFNQHFYLDGVLVAEPVVDDVPPGDNAFFDD